MCTSSAAIKTSACCLPLAAGHPQTNIGGIRLAPIVHFMLMPEDSSDPGQGLPSHNLAIARPWLGAIKTLLYVGLAVSAALCLGKLG